MFDKKLYLSREETAALKGFALVLMFAHHFFGFPSYYVGGIEYPVLFEYTPFIAAFTKICVSIFAFITGYTYTCSKKQDYRYSARKMSDIWTMYLLCFGILLIPALLTKTYLFSLKDFVLELFALKRLVMRFCWYVVFYYLVMLLLPIYARLAKKNIVWALLLCFIPILVPAAYGWCFETEGIVYETLNTLIWFPCIGVGFVFGQYELFEKIEQQLKRGVLKSKFVAIAISSAGLVLPLFCRVIRDAVVIKGVTILLDFIYAPIIVGAFVWLYREMKWIHFKKLMQSIGKQSLAMWFVHGVFFNCSEKYTQILLYFPKNPLLVLVWGLVSCYFVSVGITFVATKINRRKNEALKL